MRVGRLLGAVAMAALVVIADAPRAGSYAQLGGWLFSGGPRHIARGDSFPLNGQVPFSGPPPCPTKKYAGPCPAFRVNGRAHDRSSERVPSTRITWRVRATRLHPAYYITLGRVQGLGMPNNEFKATFRVPMDSPFGGVVITGHTHGLPNIQDGRLIVTRRADLPRRHLPNTGGPTTDLGWLATLVSITAGAGAVHRRRGIRV